MMNNNEVNERSEYRKDLDDWIALQKEIHIDLTDLQVRDIENVLARTVAEITTNRLRRITNEAEYLSRKQARKYLSVTDDTLQKWIDKGMPYIKVDGTIRFYRVDLDAWLANFTVLPDIDMLGYDYDEYGFERY